VDRDKDTDLPTTMHVFRATKDRFSSTKRTTESRLDRDLRNSDMLELLLDQFEIEEIEEIEQNEQQNEDQ
jgi:hypothetical protein